MVRHYHFSFSFDVIPPVLQRGRHALVVLRDANGKFILGAKNIYPDKIVRFIGGGLDEAEPADVGATREVEEEVGVRVNPAYLKPLAVIEADITSLERTTRFTTFLFLYEIGAEELHPADDLDGIVRFSREEMEQLIDRYAHLPKEIVDIGDGGNPFRWSDYGAYYGKVHQIALECLEENVEK
ncbi:MAG: NUDIX domain-containing protein [Candidatus Pacebacteria bacterium]|nr:NUDIX domain-containing protein [Candidatus Paceibacterota bacterium]